MRLLKWLMTIFFVLFSFLLGCYFIYLITINSIDHSVFNDKTIISAIISGGGSFFGALIGGLIAFGIARSQIIQDKKRDIKNQHKAYHNIIKALSVEFEHNKEILGILCSNNKDRDQYKKSLKSEVWNTVKYNENNVLPKDLYCIIDLQSKEYEDIKEGILPQYNNIEQIDFNTRLQTTNIVIKKLADEESRTNNFK